MLSAPQIGVRHTRLVGRHKLTSEDWRAGTRFDDEIGVSPSPSQKFGNVSVPYRSLVPREVDNVLVAGRHIATDRQTQAFMREIPQCWMTGQAAGVGAALAGAADVPVADIDAAALRRELGRQGVYLQAESRRRFDGCDRRRTAARPKGLDHCRHAAVVSAGNDDLDGLLLEVRTGTTS